MSKPFSSLAAEQCRACRADSPKVPEQELAELMRVLPDWRIESVENVMRINRNYRFKDFPDALAFTNQLGDLAEAANHHPSILIEWGSASVTWWTHAIMGLHRNDFIMAARTEELYQSGKGRNKAKKG